MSPLISRGFRGRRLPPEQAARVPPGQHLVPDFPVLSAGPTPRTPVAEWSLSLDGAVEGPRTWRWEEFLALGPEDLTTDIHCVTTWSKLDTRWEGVSLDKILTGLAPDAAFVIAHCDGGYTTNLPLDDVTGHKAWIAFAHAGAPLAPEHGGPARLLVPHLYLWKSAKWVRRLEVRREDHRGFWEQLGYHDRGDPWREQRYQGD